VKNPDHTYSPGVYSVRLVVSNGINSSTVTKPSLITISPLTVAEFTFEPFEGGDVPLMIQFTDNSYGNPTSYAWNFGDGLITSKEQNPVHTYTKPGDYNVTLTVTNSNRVSSTVVHTVVLTGTPVASFKAYPKEGSSPLTVQFTDTSSNNPTEWVWTFGDGAYGYERNPVHTYNSPGKFTVTLFARNNYGTGETKPYPDLITVSQFP
jgi:PKD repeat protein